MPTINWPATVPTTVNAESFKSGGPDGSITFTVDDGPQMRRPRYSKIARQIDFQVYLTLDQAQTLDEFYDTDTARGSLPFARNDPITGLSRNWRFRSRPTFSGLSGSAIHVVASVSLESVP